MFDTRTLFVLFSRTFAGFIVRESCNVLTRRFFLRVRKVPRVSVFDKRCRHNVSRFRCICYGHNFVTLSRNSADPISFLRIVFESFSVSVYKPSGVYDTRATIGHKCVTPVHGETCAIGKRLHREYNIGNSCLLLIKFNAQVSLISNVHIDLYALQIHNNIITTSLFTIKATAMQSVWFCGVYVDRDERKTSDTFLVDELKIICKITFEWVSF